LEVVQKRARVSFASRVAFAEIALHRKRTKTPPGFKDEGDGDFFVWVDLLSGLQQAQEAGETFAKVVLVTLDRKIDWMREGAAHPILVSEVRALFGVPFEIWNIDQLASEVASSS
jgi:hypothetical protein